MNEQIKRIAELYSKPFETAMDVQYPTTDGAQTLKLIVAENINNKRYRLKLYNLARHRYVPPTQGKEPEFQSTKNALQWFTDQGGRILNTQATNHFLASTGMKMPNQLTLI